MLKCKHVAIFSLLVGLCVPAFAQEADTSTLSGPQSSVQVDHRYHHLDNGYEEALLDAGAAETDVKTLQFLQTYEPEVYREIAKMKTSDPEEYGHMVIMESHHVRTLEDLQTDDPEGFRLTIAELRANDKVGALAQTCRDSKKANTPELRAAAEVLFQARQATDRHEIEKDRKDVDDRFKELQARTANHASIVDHYVRELSVQDSERW